MKRSVVISFNWITGETLCTPFRGDGCADQAAGWADRESRLWQDFPESQGWEHWAHWSVAAGKERADRLWEEFEHEGSRTEFLPMEGEAIHKDAIRKRMESITPTEYFPEREEGSTNG